MVQENSVNKFVIVVCGPTGSGKSDLAINLAKILNTEIISADSIAIYKDLDIGTAKPSKAEQSMVKHHMIDVCKSADFYTVSDYEKQASKIIIELFNKGKIPIICGGTGFYINSLLFDLSYGNCAKNQLVREKYEKLLAEKGSKALFEVLKDCDKETAEKLHENDTMRVIRALEIFETSGIKKSSIVDSKTPKYKYLAYSYDFERSLLYDRINRRVDKMFELGLADEVKNLISIGLSLDNQCMQGIGYKEFFGFDSIDDNIDKIKELIKLNSRRYAKRQITFFKKLDGLKYLKNFDLHQATDIILKDIENEFNS